MNALKAGLIVAFSAFALMCVGYAHSTLTSPTGDDQLYASSHWFETNCQLKVRHEGGTVYFSAGNRSQTRFAGFWPDVAGTVEIPAISRSSEDGVLSETLAINFVKIGQELRPVGYKYLNERDPAPFNCTGLALRD